MKELTLGTLRARMCGGTDREGGGTGPVVVLMHGYGAPGTDLVPLWRELTVPQNVRFVFPEAPQELGFGGRAWWNIDMARLQDRFSKSGAERLTAEVPPGSEEARNAVLELLGALERDHGAAPEQVIIGGFSQGAMLATDVVLRTTRPFGGLAILSGTIISSAEWWPLLPARKGLPVLQSHGRADQVLPFAVAEQLRDALTAAGLPVEFIPFNGGHGIPGSVLDGLAAPYFGGRGQQIIMKIAAIDIGTNSVHMVVVEVNPDHGLSVIDRQKTMVRLGQGMFGTMRLSERAFADGLDVLRRYVKLAESRGVEEVLAVATSATREAENGTEFLDATFRETGILPRVISGTEEARLIFLAVRHALDLQNERTLVLDIGGGSVEISLGTQNTVSMNESLRLGVQRLLDHHGTSAPLGMRELYELQGYVHGAAAEVMSQAHKLGFDRVVGTSGTIRTLGEAAHFANGGAPFRSLNAQTVKRRDIRELTRRLVELDPAKRAKIEGIGEARADTIHLGGVLLSELLTMAEVEELTLCDASLREGVIWDYLERHGRAPTTHAPIPDPRRRSIVELARKYERDDPREHHIARLVLELFDQTLEIHGFGGYERELLEYAALVHGVGRQIGYADRHRHSRYIVRNSTLRGFTDEEIDLLGLLVFYHRQERPKKNHDRLAHLTPDQQRLIKVLSGMLRLAVALDRGHSQLVKRLRCYVFPTQVDIVIDGPGDLELELLAARDKLEPLARALKREMSIDRIAPYSTGDAAIRG